MQQSQPPLMFRIAAAYGRLRDRLRIAYKQFTSALPPVGFVDPQRHADLYFSEDLNDLAHAARAEQDRRQMQYAAAVLEPQELLKQQSQGDLSSMSSKPFSSKITGGQFASADPSQNMGFDQFRALIARCNEQYKMDATEQMVCAMINRNELGQPGNYVPFNSTLDTEVLTYKAIAKMKFYAQPNVPGSRTTEYAPLRLFFQPPLDAPQIEQEVDNPDQSTATAPKTIVVKLDAGWVNAAFFARELDALKDSPNPRLDYAAILNAVYNTPHNAQLVEQAFGNG